MRNSIYFICVPEAWMTPKFGWWLNTSQNKTKPQILLESTGWIAVNTTPQCNEVPDRSYRSPQSSWDRTLHPEQQPAEELQPWDKCQIIGFGLGFFFGCAGVWTQMLWQQLYSFSSSRNYQGVTLVSNGFNANYFFHLRSRRGLFLRRSLQTF